MTRTLSSLAVLVAGTGLAFAALAQSAPEKAPATQPSAAADKVASAHPDCPMRGGKHGRHQGMHEGKNHDRKGHEGMGHGKHGSGSHSGQGCQPGGQHGADGCPREAPAKS